MIDEIYLKLNECYNRELWRDGLIEFADWLLENESKFKSIEKEGIIKAFGMGKLAKSKTPVIDGEAEGYYFKTKNPTS